MPEGEEDYKGYLSKGDMHYSCHLTSPTKWRVTRGNGNLYPTRQIGLKK